MGRRYSVERWFEKPTLRAATCVARGADDDSDDADSGARFVLRLRGAFDIAKWSHDEPANVTVRGARSGVTLGRAALAFRRYWQSADFEVEFARNAGADTTTAAGGADAADGADADGAFDVRVALSNVYGDETSLVVHCAAGADDDDTGDVAETDSEEMRALLPPAFAF